MRDNKKSIIHLLGLVLMAVVAMATDRVAVAQAPGTVPVTISHETMMLHGRKYYVHIVEKGQTVYSISRAYKVESYDAVTHVDIHFLHPGDTVWLPARGQFSEASKDVTPTTEPEAKPSASNTTTASAETAQPTAPPTVKAVGKTIKVAVMMPLHLDKIDEISTSKFDIEQRGKKSYRQFEFIEFFEGVQFAMERLASEGVRVEMNVIDVGDGGASKVEETFASHHVAESDLLIALLLRDAFDRAAQLAKDAGIYIVNPMATRADLCEDNPFVVKMQPSVSAQVDAILKNIRIERPQGHVYIVHSGVKAERTILDELKRRLNESGDMEYTLFNWSQNAKLAQVFKKTPGCSVVTIYDQGRDLNRVFAGNLLNKLSAFKQDTPVLYTLYDWTKDYNDIDFSQLQLVSYHTFSTTWDMNNEMHVDFLREFRERYGNEPTSPMAAMGYDLTIHIVGGLHKHGTQFWNTSYLGSKNLTHPIKLKRKTAGLENESATLYKMDNLRFVPASVK